MRHRYAPICAALACAAPASPCAGAPAAAQAPEGVRVVASAAPTTVTVGDPISYTLSVLVPAGMKASAPAAFPDGGAVRVKEVGRRSVPGGKGGGEGLLLLYDVRAYRAGDVTMPPLKAVVADAGGGTAEVDGGAVLVRVESVLGGDAKEIKDIKPPLPLPYVPGGMVAVLAACLVALAAAALLLRRRRRGKAVPASPPRPPHEVAREELRRLRAMNLPRSGRVKEYYIRLSGIARRYIESRFGLRAPEMTTEEFLSAAGGSGLLNGRARALVGEFLAQCDRVKFARYGPRVDEMDGAFGAAERFVDETAPAAVAGASNDNPHTNTG